MLASIGLGLGSTGNVRGVWGLAPGLGLGVRVRLCRQRKGGLGLGFG